MTVGKIMRIRVQLSNANILVASMVKTLIIKSVFLLLFFK